jgi:hypothetical protein
MKQPFHPEDPHLKNFSCNPMSKRHNAGRPAFCLQALNSKPLAQYRNQTSAPVFNLPKETHHGQRQ